VARYREAIAGPAAEAPPRSAAKPPDRSTASATGVPLTAPRVTDADLNPESRATC
jgi:hypothetical protein